MRIEKPKIVDNAFVKSFYNSIGVEINNTNQLMNWIIFGDVKQKSFLNQNNNEF